MDYLKISKETISFLYKSYESLKASPLDASILPLVELRVSQINGCSYCCRVHTQDAKKAGVSEEKIDGVAEWHTSNVFSEKERAALAWAEELNALSTDLKEKRRQLEQHLSEREIVDLTACISIMNALNRIAISLRD